MLLITRRIVYNEIQAVEGVLRFIKRENMQLNDVLSNVGLSVTVFQAWLASPWKLSMFRLITKVMTLFVVDRKPALYFIYLIPRGCLDSR